MPITRTYGPSAGLVADLGYSAGSNMQQTEDLMAMLQLLAGVNSTALNDKQQKAALAQKYKESEDAKMLQLEQLWGNPVWVANHNARSQAASGVNSGAGLSRWSAF